MYDSIRGVLVIIFDDVQTQEIWFYDMNSTLFYDLVLLIECSNWKTPPTLNAKIGEHYARRMHLIS